MEQSEGGSKRSRKPYTLTKMRESWSNDEHERFIKALQLYNRDWKKIEGGCCCCRRTHRQLHCSSLSAPRSTACFS